MDETAYFKYKKMIPEKLLSYGFIKNESGYRISKAALDGQFRLDVAISDSGQIDMRMIDCSSKEEYVLHRVAGTSGSFAGAVKEAYEETMFDIAEKCFEADVFKSEQARELITHVRNTYGDELEYLWARFPDNAVWRRKDTKKWYGALLTVSKRKLGIESDEIVEIIDLRIASDKLADLVDNKKFFPGWHMNKKNWFTIILDGSVPLPEITAKISESYQLAKK